MSYRIFSDECKDIIYAVLKRENKYCNFVMKRQRIKKSNSQKKCGPFWKASICCKRPECSMNATLSIPDENGNKIIVDFNNIWKTSFCWCLLFSYFCVSHANRSLIVHKKLISKLLILNDSFIFISLFIYLFISTK